MIFFSLRKASRNSKNGESRLRRLLGAALLLAAAVASIAFNTGNVAAQSNPPGKVRIAIVGLNHDHVWGILKDISSEPQAELVAIAEKDSSLVTRAKGRVPANVVFYDDFVKMLDEAKPDAVFATTANDRHLEILRECAKRHVHFSTEKPMAVSGADAREMAHLAQNTGIKLMVNYWNAWVAPTPAMFQQVRSGAVGPVQKIVVEYGHSGPREIGVSKQFAEWLYDPQKNGGGAIVDFGCYGAEWALWLKGKPSRVFATAKMLKTDQHNQVDDDATLVLDYPDGTAILQASWDWPYGMERVKVFGPKGSLLATGNELIFRGAKDKDEGAELEGKPVSVTPLAHERSNPVSYFVYCIRENKPIEDPVSAELNVRVVEILDAARESIRTGQAQNLP